MLAVALSLALSGCASISEKFAETASQAPKIGLSANTPARPAQQIDYPAVHDVPPPRTATVLTDVEQQKLETDLVAARNQQMVAAGISPAKKTQPAKAQTDKAQAAKTQANRAQSYTDQSNEAAPISSSSSRTIY